VGARAGPNPKTRRAPMPIHRIVLFCLLGALLGLKHKRWSGVADCLYLVVMILILNAIFIVFEAILS